MKSYSQQKLLRQYFELWRKTIVHDQYDLIAIEFHNRQLLKNVFHIWLNSILHNRQIAIEHINHKRTRNTWHIWKIQLNKRQRHKHQYLIANEQHNRRIIISGKQRHLNDSRNLRNVYELIIIIVFIYKEFVLPRG
jgi:hypothetical protein